MRGLLFQPSKLLLAIAIIGMIGVLPARMFGQAEAPAAGGAQPQWKDRRNTTCMTHFKRYEHENPAGEAPAMGNEVPANGLRQAAQVASAHHLRCSRDAQGGDRSRQAGAGDGRSQELRRPLCHREFYYRSGRRESVARGARSSEKAANTLLASMDTPPAGVTEAQWNAQKPQLQDLAHTTLGWIAMQRKNWAGAQAEFLKSLQINPNDGQVDYFLPPASIPKKTRPRYPRPLFYFARAATYGRQGALKSGSSPAAMGFVQKAYKSFHGSDADFNKLPLRRKPVPRRRPTSLLRTRWISLRLTSPMKKMGQSASAGALWKNIKMALMGADGTNYFSSSMKDAQLPTLKGKDRSALDPETKPKTILLAIDDGSGNSTTADATLKFDMPLAGKVDPGTELTFEAFRKASRAQPTDGSLQRR